MFRKTVCLLALLGLLAFPARALEVAGGDSLGFRGEDFAGEALVGICIRDLPQGGRLTLGNRLLREGDVLTRDQLEAMTFTAGDTETDEAVTVGYLPIGDCALEEAVLTISIRGKEDKAPVAEDLALETYKNLPLTGSLKVSDPEGQAVTCTLVRQPRRGSVALNADGTFTYTPRKNKVGVDSFTFTATDPAGKVSREATVTITILKPTESARYTDTQGRDCAFAAEWMRQSGIFTAETLAGQSAFSPDKNVTRGEFVTMLVKALEIPAETEAVYTGYTDEVPGWLRPYLTAAVRSGLTAGLPEQEVFGAEEAITGAEAAVMLANALDLAAARETAASEEAHWAAQALAAIGEQGMALEADAPLTREAAALTLYRVTRIQEENRLFPD